MNKKREIAFSVMFLILTYYLVAHPSFLIFEDKGELILFIMLIIGSLYLTTLSTIELIKLKTKSLKDKIVNSFCIISSLGFLLASVYVIIVR